MQNNDFMNGGEDSLNLDEILGGSLFDNLISQIKGGNDNFSENTSSDSDVDGGFFGDSSDSEHGGELDLEHGGDSEHGGEHDLELGGDSEHGGYGRHDLEHGGDSEHDRESDDSDVKSLTFGSDDDNNISNFVKQADDEINNLEDDVKSIVMSSDDSGFMSDEQLDADDAGFLDADNADDAGFLDANYADDMGFLDADDADAYRFVDDDYPPRPSSPDNFLNDDNGSTSSHARTMSMSSNDSNLFGGDDVTNQDSPATRPPLKKPTSKPDQRIVKVTRSSLVDYDGYGDPLVINSTEINSNVDKEEQEHLLEVAGDIVKERNARKDNIQPRTGGFKDVATAIANKYFV